MADGHVRGGVAVGGSRQILEPPPPRKTPIGRSLPMLTQVALQVLAESSVPSVEATGAAGVFLTLIVGVGGVGGIGGIVALLMMRTNKRKLEADASETITKAATALVDPLQREVSRLHDRVESLESERTEQRVLLAEHSAWDHIALIRLADAGILLPEAPPLFPKRPLS